MLGGFFDVMLAVKVSGTPPACFLIAFWFHCVGDLKPHRGFDSWRGLGYFLIISEPWLHLAAPVAYSASEDWSQLQ